MATGAGIAGGGDHDALRREVATLIERLDRRPLPRHLDERFARLVEAQKQLHDAGLAVVAWPERFGGRGFGPAEAAVVAGALGRAGTPETINFVALEVVAPALLRYATEEQLARWLPPMGPAEEVWCQLFSEPDAGSDLTSLRTRAVRDGDDWLVTGSKVWCTWGQFAHRGLLLARTGSVESRHKGISAFVVDMHAPGIDVRPLTTMTGISEFAEVHFEQARVPGSDLVGDVDGGWLVALEMLSAERGPYAVRRASVLQGALVALHAEIQARSEASPNAALGATSGLRRRIVDATIAMELLERRISQVVRQLEQGLAIGAEAAVTKMLLTRAEQHVFAACQEALGLPGVAWVGEEHPWVEAFLYSRAASIYGGTEQIQRNTIGERLLGLPREPQSS